MLNAYLIQLFNLDNTQNIISRITYTPFKDIFLVKAKKKHQPQTTRVGSQEQYTITSISDNIKLMNVIFRCL